MQQTLSIEGIPALLWGPPSHSLFLAVHGDLSHKADTVIAILAEEAVSRGHQVLSFDLPEHGERSGQPRLCNAQNCVEDLHTVLRHARTLSQDLRLFGCSVGAYFSMLAFREAPLRQALFLSPVVDMQRIIENMMTWFSISEQQLRAQGEIATPMKTLYWDYYQYVKAHPVRWKGPTALLYGSGDTLCEPEFVRRFASGCGADMTTMEGGEHFFHTEQQLAFLREWLREHIQLPGAVSAKPLP